jgi:hypothetical protein
MILGAARSQNLLDSSAVSFTTTLGGTSVVSISASAICRMKICKRAPLGCAFHLAGMISCCRWWLHQNGLMLQPPLRGVVYQATRWLDGEAVVHQGRRGGQDVGFQGGLSLQRFLQRRGRGFVFHDHILPHVRPVLVALQLRFVKRVRHLRILQKLWYRAQLTLQ